MSKILGRYGTLRSRRRCRRHSCRGTITKSHRVIGRHTSVPSTLCIAHTMSSGNESKSTRERIVVRVGKESGGVTCQ